MFSAFLLIALIWTGATVRLDNAVYDLTLKAQRHAIRKDIVIVAIDPKSLEQEGQWPWPRRAVASLISDVAADKPKALACYLIFLLPTTPADDAALHNAMLQTKTFVPLLSKPGADGHLKPLPLIHEVSSAVAGSSPADIDPDQDGIVRHASLFENVSDHERPRLELQMAQIVGINPERYRRPQYRAPILIPFRGPPASFTTYSAMDVLAGHVPKGLFRDKFILIGATAPDMLDVNPTPMSAKNNMSSVEVAANILNGLLDDRWILGASKVTTSAVWLTLIAVLLVGLLRLDPARNLWLAAALSVLPMVAVVLGVSVFGVWVPPAAYLVTLAIVIPFWGWRRLNATSAYFADELRELEMSIGGGALAPLTPVAGLGGDVVLRQITLLEETRRRISDLRRFVSDILENFPDPVFVVDRRGRMITVNDAAHGFAIRAGVSVVDDAPIESVLAKLVGQGDQSKAIWPPPESPMGGSSVSPVAVTEPGGRIYEVRFTPTRDADDEPTGWIVHMADVTTLVSAMRQREEALELISHDMRSPQAAILAAIDHAGGQPAPQTLLQRIAVQARRTLSLADGFVQLARAEAAEYQVEAIDLTHVIFDAAEAVWALANAAGVEIEFNPDDIEYVIKVDRGLLTRAIINLFDNAVKYSEPGGKVTCRLAPATLREAPAVACEIADTGAGMSQEVREGLFRRFAPTSRAKMGTPSVGLGLALVQTVIMKHGGSIDCRSAQGEGTVFTLLFPLHEDQDTPAILSQ